MKCEVDLPHFCGWCLLGFKDGCACHDHGANYAVNLNIGSCYGTNIENPLKEFNEAQAPVRKKRIINYMNDNNLSAEERKALVSLMQKADLDSLGITKIPI